VADPALVLFSFSLGAAAFFSPCGFPMLPAYLAYYLPRRGEGEEGVARALLRGIGGGALAGLGAMLVLLLIGGAAIALGAPFKRNVVLLELAGGLLVLGLGVATLLGKGPSATLALRPSRKRDALGLAAFGALYAAVAASCVAPLLLSVLVLAFAAPTPVDGALYVLAYAAGMGSLLVAVTALVATAQDAFVSGMKRTLPWMEKASGVLLVAVGLYLVYFWASVEYGLPTPPTWTPPFV
jgi:cytochrome c-type biogenesis protein